MSDPLSNFASLESEWNQIKQGINLKLTKDCPIQSGESRKATLRNISSELDEGDEIVEQMEIEAKGKAKLMIVVRSYQSELKNFRSQVKTWSTTSDRDALFSQSSSNPHSSYTLDIDEDEIDAYSSRSQSQRARLLSSTNALKTSEGRLDNATRLAMESEEIGGNVLGALRGQTSTLQETRDMLGTADSNIAKASTTIKKMVRQMYKQRIVLVVAIAVLGSLILLILYNKYR